VGAMCNCPSTTWETPCNSSDIKFPGICSLSAVAWSRVSAYFYCHTRQSAKIGRPTNRVHLFLPIQIKNWLTHPHKSSLHSRVVTKLMPLQCTLCPSFHSI
jgi:hypothetical protein